MPKAKPIPEGFHALTPSLTVKDARKAVEFYKKAFGAKQEGGFHEMPGGKVGHVEVVIGDSRLMLAEEFPDFGSVAPKGQVSSSLYLYVADCDKVFKAAVDAGAKTIMPLADMFWGDRAGTVQDPSGHRWMIATHKEDLSETEMNKRMEQQFSAQAK